jgi:hypothetical protein
MDVLFNSPVWNWLILSDQLGTFNTFKATIPYVRQSHGSYIHVSAALHYRGKANPLGASTGN